MRSSLVTHLAPLPALVLAACLDGAPATSAVPQALTAERTVGAAADTHVRQGVPNQSHGTLDYLRIRQSGKNRALVRFDAGDVAAAVGGFELVSAQLAFDITDNGENWGSGRTVDLHRLTVPWTEDATWNHSGLDDWEMQGPSPRPWDATPSATATITSTTAGVLTLDVTADVAAVLAGAPDHGWILKKTDEGAAGMLELASRETGAGGPRLVLALAGCTDPAVQTIATVPGALNPVVDGADLFLTTSGGGLYRAPALGGAAVQIGAYGGQLHVDGDHVYAATENSGIIARTPRGGGGDLVLHDDDGEAHAITADATHVYYGVSGPDTGQGTGTLWRRPAAGGAAEQLDSGLRGPWALTDDATHVYGTVFYAGAVYRWAKAGGAREVIAVVGGNAAYLALDDTHVYFVTVASCCQNPGPNQVVRAPRTPGGPVEVVAMVGSNTAGVAVDDTHVYWSELNGRLWRRPKDLGGAAELVLDGLSTPQGLDVDDGRLYWADYTAGHVRALCTAAL